MARVYPAKGKPSANSKVLERKGPHSGTHAVFSNDCFFAHMDEWHPTALLSQCDHLVLHGN